MDFDWDEIKAASNLKKHKVSFKEAETVFDDSLFIAFADPDHSFEEQRFIIMGESNEGRLIVVAYTLRGEKIRLITARRATPAERRFYEK